MRFSKVLCAQHLGYYFKRHWLVQGKRTPRECGAKQVLASKGLPVFDALDIVKPEVKLNHPYVYNNNKFTTFN